MSHINPILLTGSRITSIPPKHIAPIRSLISRWILPDPMTGFDRLRPPRALRRVLFFRL